jgi:predicted RNase H-like HicB family nuclease
MAATSYALYLESGPKRRKTMVHALDVLGCVAVGATTNDALAATPQAIRAYLRFLRRHGESCDPDAPFGIHVAEHVTEGAWLGNGSPYLVFGPDVDPLTDAEIDTYLRRFAWMREELAVWAASQTTERLDAVPAGGGRTSRAVLLHMLGVNYLASALGAAPGFSALHGACERGELPLPDALRRAATLAADRVHATSADERSAVRELPSGPRTLRKALRRMLEHDWEHHAELARRPGGPAL